MSTYLPAGLPAPSISNDDLDGPYWRAALEHRLVIQRCASCAGYQWGPEWMCHRCRSFEVEWADVPAQGTIWSWERPWHPVTPALSDGVPYIIVLVELDAAPGVRVVGNLLGPRDQQVQIGAVVTGEFEDHDGYTLLHWTTGSA